MLVAEHGRVRVNNGKIAGVLAGFPTNRLDAMSSGLPS